MTSTASIRDLLAAYDEALDHTDRLWSDLSDEEVQWRADDTSSAIGWHLGHQPAVAHFMVRNLTAAEPPIDPALDALMDSATPPTERGALPDVDTIRWYRASVAERVRVRIGDIRDGNVGAPNQLELIARTLLIAVINHEYQHSKWIGEVRTDVHDRSLPEAPSSPLLSEIDGYIVIGA